MSGVSIELDVSCDICGKGLSVTQSLYRGNSCTISVVPCEDCTKEVKDEGYDEGYSDGYDDGHSDGYEEGGN